MRHVVVMVTTSYPRFPGDSVGTFMEPIAKGVAARGHEVHVVAPWHPRLTRGKAEDGVFFHFFRYAPVPALNVFGYAAGLRADVTLKGAAWVAAPLAAKQVFQRAGFVTACSQDLAERAVALGAAADRLEVVPYGVDASRFRPAPGARETARARLGIPPEAPLLFAAGRLVRKKGFEYLIDALPLVDRGCPPPPA